MKSRVYINCFRLNNREVNLLRKREIYKITKIDVKNNINSILKNDNIIFIKIFSVLIYHFKKDVLFTYFKYQTPKRWVRERNTMNTANLHKSIENHPFKYHNLKVTKYET